MSQNKNAANDQTKLMDKIVSLAKRRGYVYQSSEIYGGLNGCWDYGPLGVEMLNNLKQQWWRSMTYRENIEGIDASILMHPRVWEASGHVENFTDPMIDCKQCKSRFRMDVLGDSFNDKKQKKAIEALKNKVGGNENLLQQIDEVYANPGDENPFDTILENKNFSKLLLEELNCPQCGNKNTFTEARNFNLMFKTFIGPVEDSGAVVFLRPETAQGIYVNFLNVQSASRQKLPFGIAQIGKAFRNEINTKNFLFRTREFEQMEMQFFVKPGTDDRWFEYWRSERLTWFNELGMTPGKLRWHQHPKGKLAHYAKDA